MRGGKSGISGSGGSRKLSLAGSAASLASFSQPCQLLCHILSARLGAGSARDLSRERTLVIAALSAPKRVRLRTRRLREGHKALQSCIYLALRAQGSLVSRPVAANQPSTHTVVQWPAPSLRGISMRPWGWLWWPRVVPPRPVHRWDYRRRRNPPFHTLRCAATRHSSQSTCHTPAVCDGCGRDAAEL